MSGHWNSLRGPAILVPDNCKTAVRRPCRYEPDLNPTYAEMAAHYGMAVIPARVRKPRDACFKIAAAVEGVDYRHPGRLDRQLIRTLSASEWVRQHQNLLIIGPCGVGKSFLACTLAHKAVRDGFSAFYCRAPRLLRDLAVARADGSFAKLLDRLARVDVLVVDDWAMAPLADGERRDFLEICDDRYSTRSTVLTSQVPVAHWHDQIGDPTVADSILDRLVHNAHRIELQGPSMRKTKSGKPESEKSEAKNS